MHKLHNNGWRSRQAGACLSLQLSQEPLDMKLLSSLLLVIGLLSLVATPFTFGASAAGALVAFLLSRVIEEEAMVEKAWFIR